MKNFLKNFQPADIIAIITIVGGLYLKLCGADGTVGSILMIVVAAYFGKKGVEGFIQTTNTQNDDKLQTK